MADSPASLIAPAVIAPAVPLINVVLALLPAILVALGGAIVSIFKPSVMKAGLKLLWRKKLQVAIFAACVTGAVYGLGRLFGGGPGVTETRAGRDWPAYRGGPRRLGAAGEGPDPVRPGNVWSFAKEVKTFYASPAVVGNRVYVCSADKGIWTDRGAVYCLDADTGGVVWKYSPRDFRATYSSPSVAGRYLVCGEGLHFTRDARITCLDVTRKGERVWELRTNSHVESSPCIYDDKVYIGAGDDGVYCVALAAASGGEPRVVWHQSGKTYPDCETSPVAADGRVYLGLGEAGTAVVCFDADDGKEIWKRDTPYPVFGSPALAEGKVFVGMGNGNLIYTAEQLRDQALKELKDKGATAAEIAAAAKRLAPAGEVWCLDARTGQVLWTFEADRTVMGAIAVADDRLYFGTQGGMFHCLSLEGRPLARAWNARDAVNASPAVGEELVYFITGGGRLFGLDRRTLSPRFEMAVGTGGRFVSSPVVANGHVYVGTELDGFFCVGEAEIRRRVPLWGGRLGGPGRGGWADGSPLPERGRFAWRYPKPEDDSEVAMRAPAGYLDEALYVPVEGPRTGLAKIVPKRTRRRGRAEEKWFYPTPRPIVLSPAARGPAVYVVDGRAGQEGRSLHCLAAADGSLLWKRPVADDAPGHMVVTESALYVYDAPDRLTCLALGDPEGEPRAPRLRWRAPVTAPVGLPLPAGAIVLAASADPPQVAALSDADGSGVWRAALHAEPVTGPVRAQALVAVGTARGLTVLSPADGRSLWTAPCGRVTAPPVCDDERLACVSVKDGQAKLCVFEWTGRCIFDSSAPPGAGGAASAPAAPDVPKPVPGLSPMLVGETVLYGAPGSLEGLDMSFERKSKAKTEGADAAEGEDDEAERKRRMKVSRWLRVDPAFYGEITTGCVLAQSQIFFGTARRGLVCATPR